MADATANRLVDTKQQNTAEGGYYVNYDVAATAEIYQGTYLTGDAGNDLDSAGNSAEGFGCVWGVAVERVTGGAADGDETARVLVAATIVDTLTSTHTDVGAAVFCER